MEKIKFKNFIIDVDGVFTDGGYYYTTKGKMMKKFGSDDNDALTLLKDLLNIHAISGDKRGFLITKRRIKNDMGLKLDLVSTFERLDWIIQHYNPKETIYMADGIFDTIVFKKVGYSIAPANAFSKTRELADFVTEARGGEGAVAEACIHILKKFFNIDFDLEKLNLTHGSGVWEK